jgi:hypothetical protein
MNAFLIKVPKGNVPLSVCTSAYHLHVDVCGLEG